MRYSSLLLAAAISCCSTAALADWQLVKPSEVTLLSTKNTHLSEVFHFKNIQGNIDAAGNTKVELDLTSIDTDIEIRDQRMKDILFKTNLFPKAVLSAKVDPKLLQQTHSTTLKFDLHLHGQSQTLSVPVLVVADKNDNIVVTNLKPVLVQANDFELAEGIEKLREIAKLERISETVPVNFTLTFQPDQP